MLAMPRPRQSPEGRLCPLDALPTRGRWPEKGIRNEPQTPPPSLLPFALLGYLFISLITKRPGDT